MVRFLSKIFFTFFLFISPMFSSPEFSISSRFDRDSCTVGELAYLSIDLKWKGKPEDLDIVNIKIPSVSWFKVEDTGTSWGVHHADSAFYNFKICLLFLAPGEFQLDDIRIFYRYLKPGLKQTVLSSGKIRIKNRDYENPSDYFEGNYLFLILVLVIIILLIAFYLRYRRVNANLFNEKTYHENAIIINDYLSRLNRLFNKKKLNYADSLIKLIELTRAFKEESAIRSSQFFPSISRKADQLLKKMDVLHQREFVSFNEFENIYYEIYQLIKNMNTEQSNGGKQDDGYSEDQ